MRPPDPFPGRGLPRTEGGATITLRPASPEDRVFLWRVHRESMRTYVEKHWVWDEDEQLQRFLGGLNLALTQVIRLGGEDAGFLTVSEEPGEIFLRQISVLPVHQRRGIGSAVIRRLLERGLREGKSVGLQVLKGNPARGLYERLGFSVFDTTALHHRMRWSPPAGPAGGSSRRP